jgi:hypothetical protein
VKNDGDEKCATITICMNDTTQKQEYDEQRGKEEKKKGVNTLDR